jgi:hypothetical protein
MKKVIITGMVIGLICLISVYGQDVVDSGKGGAGGKSGQDGQPGGDGTVISGLPQNLPSETANTEEISKLISNLNSDDINVRDKATEELKKIGSPALPMLEEAAKNDNPEVAWRAKIIIKAISRAAQKKQDESPDSLPKKIGPTLRQFSNRFNITINNASPGTKSFALSQDSSGKISVTVTEYDKDGKQNTKTYTADSLDEFKKKYPEIAKEYGIGENQPPSFVIPDFDAEDIWKDFGNAWGKRWDELKKQLEKLKEMLKQHNKNAPESEPDGKLIIPPDKSETPANLGIYVENLSDSLKQTTKIENGLLVTTVEPNGLGDKMGLKDNDIIISVNGAEVKTIWECRRLIRTAIENGKVQLIIVRNEKKQILTYQK